jgi:hypothetical protein
VNGAGLLCETGSSPAVTYCVFLQNNAPGGGAGMRCADSSNPTVRLQRAADRSDLRRGRLQPDAAAVSGQSCGRQFGECDADLQGEWRDENALAIGYEFLRDIFPDPECGRSLAATERSV